MKITSKNIRARIHRLSRAGALAGVCLFAAACGRNTAERDGLLVLSGNIEVVDAQLGFKIPGRVVERTISEGQRVSAGQPIARLDDVEQRQQLELRQAELAAAEAALAELEAGSRPQEIASAEATVRSAEAERDRAQVDFSRFEDLRTKDAVTVRDFDTAQAQLRVADAKVVEAGERLKLLKEGPRAEQIAQAKARVQQARASVSIAQTQVENTKLAAPFSGIVVSHNIEPGEFVAAGTPIVTVADTLHTWVRAYVNQTDLGRVHLGQKLKIRTDTAPDKTFEGTVSFISSEAEFTPKTVQTPKERVKLVFRVKVDVLNTTDELKPGMAADVEIPARAE
ncbi:MAG: HlyD family efflux transporter periplasmic adaptor subunit [Nibricoccus sp.]